MGIRKSTAQVFEQIESTTLSSAPGDISLVLISKSQEFADKFAADLGSDTTNSLSAALKQCSPVLICSAFLLRALEADLRTRFVDGLPQRFAHDLVDHWATLQASRALFVELCEQNVPGSVGSHFLPARFEALTRELKQTVVGLIEALGEGSSFASWAPVADWALNCLSSAKIGSFDGSIAQAMRSGV
jgi:hypothetical protein